MELLTRQTFDSVIFSGKSPVSSSVYSLEVAREYQLDKTHAYKILHERQGEKAETLFVITDKGGERAFTNMLRRVFAFKDNSGIEGDN